MKDLKELVAALRREIEPLIGVAVALYPKDADTGLLDVQGDVANQIVGRVSTMANTVCRVMWSQIAFLLPKGDLDDAQRSVSAAIADCLDSRLEIRTLIVSLPAGGDERIVVLDEALGELSSRRNFATSALREVRRLVGTQPWWQAR